MTDSNTIQQQARLYSGRWLTRHACPAQRGTDVPASSLDRYAAVLLHSQGWLDVTYTSPDGSFRLSRGNKVGLHRSWTQGTSVLSDNHFN